MLVRRLAVVLSGLLVAGSLVLAEAAPPVSAQAPSFVAGPSMGSGRHRAAFGVARDQLDRVYAVSGTSVSGGSSGVRRAEVVLDPSDRSIRYRTHDTGPHELSSGTNAFAWDTAVHVVVTHDRVSGDVRIYLDGIETAAAGPPAAPPALTSGPSAFVVGRATVGATVPFGGVLDEFAVYSDVLPSATVEAHHRVGTGSFEPSDAIDYAQAVDGGSPGGYWRLGEPSGLVASDSSGNRRNATFSLFGFADPLLGAPGLIVGEADRAVRFEAGADVLIAGDLPDLTGDLSLEAWIRPVLPGSGTMAIAGTSVAGNLEWSLGADGSVTASLDGGGTRLTSPAGAIGNDTTHHVALTYVKGTTTTTLWVDGVEVASGPAGVLAAQPPVILLGRGTTGGVVPYRGLFDEAALYSSALTGPELAARYHTGVRDRTVAHSWAYTYDGDGRRLTETDPFGEVHDLWWDPAGGPGQLSAITDSSGNPVLLNLHGQGLLATGSPAGLVWTHHDTQGSVAATSDPASQSRVSLTTYEPFGTPRYRSSTTSAVQARQGYHGYLSEPGNRYHGASEFRGVRMQGAERR